MGTRCLLCQSPAEFSKHGGGNHTYIRCAECGSYIITTEALAELGYPPEHIRQGYSQMAKTAPPDQIMWIMGAQPGNEGEMVTRYADRVMGDGPQSKARLRRVHNK